MSSESTCRPQLGEDVECTYYFSTQGCCCEGLVWAPDAPANVKATAYGNSIHIVWDEDTSATQYTLWWGKSATIELGTDNRTILTDNSFTHRDLKYNQKYYYYLKASNKYGGDGTDFSETTENDPDPEPPLNDKPRTLILMKNKKLYKTVIDNFDMDSFQEIASDGWEGDLEVSRRKIYLMKNGNLYGATNDNIDALQLIDSGGWEGVLSVSGNRIYLMKNGNLYGSIISDFIIDSLHLIDQGGWEGELDVEGSKLYLMKNGTLYGTTVRFSSINNFILEPLQKIASGGWEGDLEASGKILYLMKNNTLYGTTIYTTSRTNTFEIGTLQEIDFGGWNGDVEIGHGRF
jgi:hypothetical protein